MEWMMKPVSPTSRMEGMTVVNGVDDEAGEPIVEQQTGVEKTLVS
jgi:hypothetical protein